LILSIAENDVTSREEIRDVDGNQSRFLVRDGRILRHVKRKHLRWIWPQKRNRSIWRNPSDSASISRSSKGCDQRANTNTSNDTFVCYRIYRKSYTGLVFSS